MRSLAILALLFLAACNPVYGGEVVGKTIVVYNTKDADGNHHVCYFIQVMRRGSYGTVGVPKDAWYKCSKGDEWPFEVKK